MSEDNLNSQEVDRGEIRDLISRFRLCADAAAELAESIERFTAIFGKVERNVTELKEIDKNLSSKEYMKSLLESTDYMKEIFQYFKAGLPELSKTMELTKKELDEHKEELQFLNAYFHEIPKELEKVTGTEASNIRNSVIEDMTTVLNSSLQDFRNETLKLIKDSVEKAVYTNVKAVLKEIVNQSENETENKTGSADESQGSED